MFMDEVNDASKSEYYYITMYEYFVPSSFISASVCFLAPLSLTAHPLRPGMFIC